MRHAGLTAGKAGRFTYSAIHRSEPLGATVGGFAVMGSKASVSVLLQESVHKIAGPFIVPQRHFLEREFTRPIDQDRRMHLPTGSDSSDPIGAMCYFRDDTPDTEDYSLPPGARTLLGPAKMGNDLIISFRRERYNLSDFRNGGCPGTSGSDIDRKQEILFHEQHRLQSTKNSSLLANSNTSSQLGTCDLEARRAGQITAWGEVKRSPRYAKRGLALKARRQVVAGCH
jgi:hypothetical protein